MHKIFWIDNIMGELGTKERIILKYVYRIEGVRGQVMARILLSIKYEIGYYCNR
jgi:hypothetical protein